MSDPEAPDQPVVDCDDEPKLTAEEWAYVEALGEAD